MGSEARIIETDTTTFAAVSLATTDSYQDKDGNWQDKETEWHQVVAFNPKVIEVLYNLKKGTRIEVEGALSYRPFDTNMVNDETGEVIVKRDASIIARMVKQAPLPRKSYEAKEETAEPETA